uniref:AlNc14C358G10963 protein n=1 Tax=Albugo laibachii Nc14 TaxID=890382 RepID=F0WXL2_9STRA|nr:AlNc14C358G10963 [Albugo laibachii Nc14]|eukprot:CCA26206.1 AlNc14C358G10963 [Albugo laibachii Nc14]
MFGEVDMAAERSRLTGYLNCNGKQHVKLLIAAILPMDLRFRNEQIFKYEDVTAKDDPKKLWKMVLEKTAQFNEAYLANRYSRVDERLGKKNPEPRNVGKKGMTEAQDGKVKSYKGVQKVTSEPKKECWH